jgi:lipid-A-disaccharide synthase-like uncharacterized protein
MSNFHAFRRELGSRLRESRWVPVCSWVLVIGGVVGIALALRRHSTANVVIESVVVLVGLVFLALIYGGRTTE